MVVVGSCFSSLSHQVGENISDNTNNCYDNNTAEVAAGNVLPVTFVKTATGGNFA